MIFISESVLSTCSVAFFTYGMIDLNGNFWSGFSCRLSSQSYIVYGDTLQEEVN